MAEPPVSAAPALPGVTLRPTHGGVGPSLPSDLQRTFTKALHGPDERWERADWTPRAPGTVRAAEDGPPLPGCPRPCPAARPPALLRV